MTSTLAYSMTEALSSCKGQTYSCSDNKEEDKKVVLEFSPELESLSRTVPVLASCRFLPTSPLFEISGRLEVGIVAENGRKNWLPPSPRADVIKRFSLSVVVDDVASNNRGCSSLSTFTQKLCLLGPYSKQFLR